MAGTATNWRTAAVAQGVGRLWADLAIPAGGARLTLDADGTPDSVANPNAIHLGATKAGARLMIKSTWGNYNVDEFKAPIITNVDAIQMGISAELVGVHDTELLEFLLPGIGTLSAAAGYEQISVGTKAITYSSVALIAPSQADATKFTVFHLYRAVNDAGVEWAQGRTELGGTPMNLVGYEITTRDAADTLGSFWKQI